MSGFDVSVRLERRFERGEPFALDASFTTGGGTTVVFGASGSGKTTLLLAVLGMLEPDRGRIRAAGIEMFDSDGRLSLPVRERRLGMVFQDALLFPHLSVRRNVAFGIRGRGRQRRADELLERVRGAELADRRPAELSGGEQQRVALARALAVEPAALLLDEPFSALDRPARQELGRLLLELQSDSGIPFLHVTHDLGEALELGTHLVLLNRGRVMQVGPPAEVIARPESIAAARAVGTENVFSATVLSHSAEQGCTEVDLTGTRVQTGLLDEPPGARVAIGLRAEDVLLALKPVRDTSARNLLPGTVEDLTPRGAAVEVRVTTPALVRVVVTPASVRELALAPGRRVYLLIKANAFHRLV